MVARGRRRRARLARALRRAPHESPGGRRAGQPPRIWTGGFTLIELVVVITIIGILAWVAYPKLTGTSEIKLDAAARRVAADLRYAQNRSIGIGVPTLLFDSAQEKYTVYAPTPACGRRPGRSSAAVSVDFLRRGEYQGVTIVSAAFEARRA